MTNERYQILIKVIRDTCDGFYGLWGKRASTIFSFQKRLFSNAAAHDMNPAEMIALSEERACQMNYEDYKAAVHGYDWQKNPLTTQYLNKPFLIHIDDDDIVTVSLNLRNFDCILSEITVEMMHVVKYLGPVRLYIANREKLTIPCYPDNIIHVECHGIASIIRLSQDMISFPKYLRGFKDIPSLRYADYRIIKTYASRLPATVTELVTSNGTLENLPPSLKVLQFNRYDYTNDNQQDYGLTLLLQTIPIGIERIKYCTNTLYGSAYQSFDDGELFAPPSCKYLEFKLGRINSDRFIFRGVKEIYITGYLSIYNISNLDKDDNANSPYMKGDYCPQHAWNCISCSIYQQEVEFIIGDGVENLILNFCDNNSNGATFASLTLLDHLVDVGTSLKQISVVVEQVIIDEGYSIEDGVPELIEKGRCYSYAYSNTMHQKIKAFQLRFPAVAIQLVNYEYIDSEINQ